MDTTKKKIDINYKVEQLEFTCRLHNCLKAEGIETLAELVKIPHYLLKKIPNLGARSIDELDRFFETHEIVGEEMNNIDFAWHLKYKYENKDEKTDMAAEIIFEQAKIIKQLEKKLELFKSMKG